MNFKVLIVIFIMLLQFSCKKDDTLTSFALNNKKIEESNDNLNIKNESFLEALFVQADKDVSLIDKKDLAKRVDAVGDDLYKYIEDLKIVIKDKNSTEFVNELFFNGDEISQEGNEFLMYVKTYKESMNSLLKDTSPRIVSIVNNSFDLSVIEDRRGIKTNWLTLNFKDFSPIISITKLSTMQSDIRRIETQFLAEMLGVKLNSKKSIEVIKTETNRQIGDNLKPIDTEIIDNSIILENTKESTIKSDTSNNVDVSNSDTKTTSNNEEITEDVVKETKPEIEKEGTKKIVPKVKAKKTHTVKRGENLYRISLKYKIPVKKIRKLNKMRNNNIVLGQVLKLE